MEKNYGNINPEKLTGNKSVLSSLLSSKINKYILLLTLAWAWGQFAWEKLWIGHIWAWELKEVVETRNSRLNHTFTLNELTRDVLARELVMTTMYAYSESLDIIPKTKGRLSKIADMFPSVRDTMRKIPQSWWVFLRSPDTKTFDDITKSVSLIRRENPSAIIAMDFEWWYVRCPQVSEDDLQKYKFPKEILDLSIEEKKYTKSKSLGQFPSAEFIGMKYQSIKDPKVRRDFLVMMEQYGQSISKLFSAYGINMIFGPSLDITDSTIWTKDEISPFAKNDRAFSNNPKNVSELGNAFIRGTMDVSGFIAVPKHFVWTGLTTANTDEVRSTDTDIRAGAILPFRDYLNLHEVDGMTLDEASENIQKWQPGWSKYEETIKWSSDEIKKLQNDLAKLEWDEIKIRDEISKLSKTKKLKKDNTAKINTVNEQLRKVRIAKNNTRTALNYASRKKSEEIWKMQNLVKERSAKMGYVPSKPPVIMVWNNDNNFYDSKTPWSLSYRTIGAITNKLSRTNNWHYGWMWNKWVLITDDLHTWSIKDYLWLRWDEVFSTATSRALDAWNHFLLFWDSNLSEILLWTKNVSTEQLKKKAQKILDMKVSLGIYNKIWERYSLNPKMYTPSIELVSQSAQSSKIWTGNNLRYTEEWWKIEPISVSNGIKNALTNSILDNCRIDPSKIMQTMCSIHPKMYDSYLAPDENNLKKQLIVVDKKEQVLYMYDLETREFIGSKAIAIGKGTSSLDGFHDKRVSGDKKTPVGYYMLVQKKDPKRIKDSIEEELYDEYGGDDGGMLVLAGAWQPQIAIHGTKKETVWLVSSGCVRMDNSAIRDMMDKVPLGSMVIITN